MTQEMTKNEFIKEIIKGFPSTFKNVDIVVEIRKYEIAIENNLDYAKLYELFLKNWRYKSAPFPGYFKQFFSQCRKNPLQLINMPSERRTALIKICNWCDTEEHTRCLYEHRKAPWHIRELFHKFKFTVEEINRARISGEIEKE